MTYLGVEPAVTLTPISTQLQQMAAHCKQPNPFFFEAKNNILRELVGISPHIFI
jgi:hypothetical protein